MLTLLTETSDGLVVQVGKHGGRRLVELLNAELRELLASHGRHQALRAGVVREMQRRQDLRQSRGPRAGRRG